MNKLDALIALRDKVKAGDAPTTQDIWDAFSVDDGITHHALSVFPAFDGSLDAAKALHDAALPGYFWSIDSEDCGVCVYTHLLDDAVLGKNDNPARAWLIAILEALIAQEQGQ